MSRAVIVLCICAAAAAVTYMQIAHTYMLREERVSLDYYIDGRVAKPFAYRVLMPIALRAMDAITPSQFVPTLDRSGRFIANFKPLFGNAADLRTGPQERYPRSIVFLAILQFTCLVGYACVGTLLYATLFPDTRWLPIVGSLLLFLLGPIVVHKLGHIFDFSVLFFVACLLLAMVTERHIIYLGVFALSCLNKETTAFMLLAYAAAFYDRMPIRRYSLMLLMQAVIFVLIYVPLRIVFYDNPGASMEVWLYHQLAYYLERPPGYFFALAVLMFSVSFRWNEKPAVLRRSMAMVPPYLALFLYAASPGELRNIYEIVPLLSMFILRNGELTVGQWWVKSDSESVRLNRSE